jgi:hypothetical protein
VAGRASDEIDDAEVATLSEGLELLRAAAADAIGFAAPTARAAAAAASAAMSDPGNATQAVQRRVGALSDPLLRRLGGIRLLSPTTANKVLALGGCLCALRFGLVRALLGAASAVLALDLARAARRRLSGGGRPQRGVGRRTREDHDDR